MKYDFLRKVETQSYPNENIEYRSFKKKSKITFFHIAVIQLSVCIVASLVLLGIQLFSDIEAKSLSDIWKNIVSGANLIIK